MRNSIKLAAILLIAGAGFLAAVPAKAIGSIVPLKADVITFSGLPSEKGVAIKVEKDAPGKAIVIVYDADGNVLYKDVMKNSKSMEKGYILNKLDIGDYTIEVTSNKQVVKKQVHVYDENYRKMFIISE
jgi:hypothetical protein